MERALVATHDDHRPHSAVGLLLRRAEQAAHAATARGGDREEAYLACERDRLLIGSGVGQHLDGDGRPIERAGPHDTPRAAAEHLGTQDKLLRVDDGRLLHGGADVDGNVARGEHVGKRRLTHEPHSQALPQPLS